MTLFAAAIRDRRRAWIWWTVALAATALLIAVSFGAIEGQDQLNETFENMPDSLRVLMGIDAEMTLTSPAGYLNSQWFANMFPILLSIYGIEVWTERPVDTLRAAQKAGREMGWDVVLKATASHLRERPDLARAHRAGEWVQLHRPGGPHQG